MDKFEATYKRKSVRKYSEKGLPSDVLKDIEDKIQHTKQLYEDIDSKIILAGDGKKVQDTFSGIKSMIARVDAPHYLIGVSEEKRGYLENMGYMLEDVVLYLTKKKIGSCWLGSGLEDELLKNIYNYDGSTLILVAFGDSAPSKNNLRKNPNSASRKDLKDLIISDQQKIPKDVRRMLDSVRMAPSAVNNQPWRFYYENNTIHVYIEKKGMFKRLVGKIGDLEKLNYIDIGIALKHLEVAADKFSKDIRFENLDKEIRDHEYIISGIME